HEQFSVSYISAVERGQLRPSLPALEKLAVRLKVPLTDLLGEGNQQSASVTAARAHAEASGLNAEVEQQVWLAQILARQGKPAEALEMLTRMRSQVSALGPAERALWHWSLARAYVLLGQTEDARSEIQEAIPHAEQAGHLELREWLRFGLGRVCQLRRQLPAA